MSMTKSLFSPFDLEDTFPISENAKKTVEKGVQEIEDILEGRDDRLLVICGPCSIHDEGSALEYAQKIVKLQAEVVDKFLLVMRVYFEKPRTTIGWKGFADDPEVSGESDFEQGLERAWKLLIAINEMGVPAATEFLNPLTVSYLSRLVSWTAIGARTSESQTHREMASHLSMPVGFKNAVSGDFKGAINGVMSASCAHSFLGTDYFGKNCEINSAGNPNCHLVLRGGKDCPNYDPITIEEIAEALREKGSNDAIVIDCSHDNSGQKAENQAFVFEQVLKQKERGSSIVGVMLESHLEAGNQPAFGENGEKIDLNPNVSITDECISWKQTKKLLWDGYCNWKKEELSKERKVVLA